MAGKNDSKPDDDMGMKEWQKESGCALTMQVNELKQNKEVGGEPSGMKE